MGVLIRGLSEAWEGKREREREIKREKERGLANSTG